MSSKNDQKIIKKLQKIEKKYFSKYLLDLWGAFWVGFGPKWHLLVPLGCPYIILVNIWKTYFFRFFEDFSWFLVSFWFGWAFLATIHRALEWIMSCFWTEITHSGASKLRMFLHHPSKYLEKLFFSIFWRFFMFFGHFWSSFCLSGPQIPHFELILPSKWAISVLRRSCGTIRHINPSQNSITRWFPGIYSTSFDVINDISKYT